VIEREDGMAYRDSILDRRDKYNWRNGHGENRLCLCKTRELVANKLKTGNLVRLNSSNSRDGASITRVCARDCARTSPFIWSFQVHFKACVSLASVTAHCWKRLGKGLPWARLRARDYFKAEMWMDFSEPDWRWRKSYDVCSGQKVRDRGCGFGIRNGED